SGMVYALDPDTEGALLWARKFGRGGKLGGVHFSMGVDNKKGVLYVPISDRSVQLLGKDAQGEAEPGLHAVDIRTGETLWFTSSPVECKESDDCLAGFSAAVTVTDDLVFAPALNGVIYAFSADSGKLIWQYDTAQEFKSVNDVDTKGGSIDLGGVYLAGGQLFVTSGYEVFGQQAGNAFMVFELDGDVDDGK
ncbi:MAG: PQQ-binding-like beta-propeller repeat protein, partial [Pseudomonadales bacterium]